MLANVQQATIKPIITAAVASGTLVHTDEYSIYARLPAWGYGHKTVCHGRGEYARDEDGDGFCEVHVNTMEGFWSLLRSWLPPHRGISQDKLPLYLGFVQFVALVHSTDPGRDSPNPKLLRDDRLATDRIRAPGRQHPVQHRHADGSLSLLGREAAGSQTRSDQRLVTTHCRFH